MESTSDGAMQRTPSNMSTASTLSRRSSKARLKAKKQSSTASVSQTAPTHEGAVKSLTSFPSLSPENSPKVSRGGKFAGFGAFASRTPTQTSDAPKKPSKHRPSIVDTLTTNSPSFRARSALFDDSPTASTQNFPGALHYASDDHIRRLITRTGPVVLVRQLAEDLAQRDVEMATFRRRAEARERELKKMLREVEVSNLDIEKRLHQLDVLEESDAARQAEAARSGIGLGNRKRSSANGINEMMGEAMEDDLGNGTDDEDYMDKINSTDRQATIRAVALGGARDVDGASAHSSQENQRSTVKGWKDYLWSGTSRKASRASSIMSDHEDAGDYRRTRANSGATRRKGLSDALFEPPRAASHGSDAAIANGNTADPQSDQSQTVSMALWTLKLFAGNSQAAPRNEESQGNARGRAVTTGDGAVNGRRAASAASHHTASSAKAALMKVNGNSSGKQPLRKPVSPLVLGPASALKASAQAARPGSPASMSSVTNLGPVEMDTILPHGTRPPTLTPSYHNTDDSAGYLTDRFGFIYDQRRRKKEAELFTRLSKDGGMNNKETIGKARSIDDTDSLNTGESALSTTPTSTDERVDGKSMKKWQDYLKIATFPTELLSHTPSSGNTMTISNPAIRKSLVRSPTFEGAGMAFPPLSPNPVPSTSSITAGIAEIAKPFTSMADDLIPPTRRDGEPVKLLLAQLTELHDSLQRDKTVKWNEFLRKVRAERRKEGELAFSSDARSKVATMPETSLADGEVIGIATLGNKGKVGRAKYKEFKSLVLAGIPVIHRAKIWSECSGASALRVPGYYDDLVNGGVDDPIILSQIKMDINRTLTDNVFFRKGPGVVRLNEVLLAYSRRNPEVGYCQGMNLITASLLLIMPTAEDAFWVLVSIIENILPRHYYDNSLLTSRADQQVLRQYVSELLPRLSSHLDELGIELEALTFQWFLSLFTDCLSAEALYRVWDVLLCCKDEDGNGGSTFLFQVALALLKLNEPQLVACETPAEVYAYLGGQITNHAISIDGLIKASDGLKGLVRRAEAEERRERWVAVERATIEERERIRRETQVTRGDDGTGREKGGPSGLEGPSPVPVDGSG